MRRNRNLNSIRFLPSLIDSLYSGLCCAERHGPFSTVNRRLIAIAHHAPPIIPGAAADPFATLERLECGEGFKLLQWPIKLWKISETAPYFHHAHLLVVEDCAALCQVNIHDRITPGRIALMCCPETDFDISMKLCKIIELNEICERKVK